MEGGRAMRPPVEALPPAPVAARRRGWREARWRGTTTQAALAGCGAAAGRELAGAVHLCALRAVVRRLALACFIHPILTHHNCTPTQPERLTFPSHNTTLTHPLQVSAPDLILAGPYLPGRFRRPGYSSPHIPLPHLNTRPCPRLHSSPMATVTLLPGTHLQPCRPLPTFLRP